MFTINQKKNVLSRGFLMKLNEKKLMSRNKKSPRGLFLNAERGGFEPPLRFRKHAFQACAFSHSATSPDKQDGKDRKNTSKY
tara:strand:+ start:3582 stop:3827 length:246 start_codon:yes stop_codon:yes gene_type:complete